MLLIVAPSFWGEVGDPIDKARKGEMHRELGAPADTAFEPKLDKVLDLAVKLDRPAITRASALFLSALADFSAEIDPASGSAPEAAATLDGVTGAIAGSFDTPWGLLVIGGPGAEFLRRGRARAHRLPHRAGRRRRYRGRAASAVGDAPAPFGALVDYGGDDVYDASDRAYVLARRDPRRRGADRSPAATTSIAGGRLARRRLLRRGVPLRRRRRRLLRGREPLRGLRRLRPRRARLVGRAERAALRRARSGSGVRSAAW